MCSSWGKVFQKQGMESVRVKHDKTLMRLAAIIIIPLLLTGCLGDDDSKSNSNAGNDELVSEQGFFLDVPVSGLSYIANGDSGLSGLTDLQGRFDYVIDETTRFFLGGISLGTVEGKARVSLSDLSQNSDIAATNIMRFLLTLDDDQDLSNGITISDAIRTLAEGVSFSADAFSAELFETGTAAEFARTAYKLAGDEPRLLVDSDVADQYIDCLASDAVDGDFDGGCNIEYQQDPALESPDPDIVGLEKLIELAGEYPQTIVEKRADYAGKLMDVAKVVIHQATGSIDIEGLLTFSPEADGYRIEDNMDSQFPHYRIVMDDPNDIGKNHELFIYISDGEIVSFLVGTVSNPILLLEKRPLADVVTSFLSELISLSSVSNLVAVDLDPNKTPATDICTRHSLQLDDGSGGSGLQAYDNGNRDATFLYALDGRFFTERNFRVSNSKFNHQNEVKSLTINNTRIERSADGYINVIELTTSGAMRLLLSNDPSAAGSSDCNTDSDGDGLVDPRELAFGSNPNNPDTDGDGLSDGAEVNVFKTDPVKFDTDGDGISDADEAVATSLCNIAGPSGSIVNGSTVHSTLIGSFDVRYASFDPLSPYLHRQTAIFTTSATTLTLPDGKVLSAPFGRVGYPEEIRWLDNERGYEYALSRNQTGVFNEINVGNACTPDANGFPAFLGQFTEYTPGVPVELLDIAGTYKQQIISRPDGYSKDLFDEVEVEIDGETGVITVDDAYVFDPADLSYSFTNRLSGAEPSYEIIVDDPNMPNETRELHIFIDNGEVVSFLLGNPDVEVLVPGLRLEKRPLPLELTTLFANLEANSPLDNMVTISVNPEFHPASDICTSHSIVMEDAAPSSNGNADYPFRFSIDNVFNFDHTYLRSNSRYSVDASGKVLDILGKRLVLRIDGNLNYIDTIGGVERLRMSNAPANIDAAGCNTDSDSDGLPDVRESALGTNPTELDSDADGLSDGDEVNLYGSNPLLLDTDGDGLNDRDEVLVYFTNPNLADSDGDGLSDGNEINLYGSNPTLSDSDMDGVSDNDEVNLYGTNPVNADSDSDGISDGEEIQILGTDPKNADSDGDGVNDGDERDAGSDPNDGSETPEIDTDGDGIQDKDDNCPNDINVDQSDIDNDGIGDVCDPVDDTDTDGDGIIDLSDNCVTVQNPLQEDGDGDLTGDACDLDQLIGNPDNISSICAVAGTDVAFVVDRSGSMGSAAGGNYPGNRLDMIKNGAGSLLFSLGEADRSALVTYNDASVQKGLDNLHDQAIERLNALSAGGGTTAEPAIDLATSLLDVGQGAKVIIHMTDGASTGTPAAAAQRAKAKGIEFFALGIGDGLSQAALDDLRDQASEPKATHFANTLLPEDFFDVLSNITSSISGGLEIYANSYALKASGNLLIVPLEMLNGIPLQNEQTYRLSDLEPDDNAIGGDNTIVPLPLGSGGSGIFSNTVRNMAVGSYNEAALSAGVDALAQVEGFSLEFAGAEIISIEAAVANSASNISQTDGVNQYSSSSESSGIARVVIQGQELPLPIEPNTIITIPGLLKVVLNEQLTISNSRTSGLEVNVAHIYFTDATSGEVTGDLVVGHSFSGVSCAGPTAFDGPLFAQTSVEPLAPITNLLTGNVPLPASPFTAQLCPNANALAESGNGMVDTASCLAEAGAMSPLPLGEITSQACPEADNDAAGSLVNPMTCLVELATGLGNLIPSAP